MHSQNLESRHSIAQDPSQAACGDPTAISGFGGLEVKVYNHMEILSFPRDRTATMKRRCGSVYEDIRITGQQNPRADGANAKVGETHAVTRILSNPTLWHAGKPER
jgi:hypothetical protein